MKRYRCGNCRAEFQAAAPACVCGVDPAKDPRHVNLLTELVTIHYDAPSGIGNLGVGTLACNPKRRISGSRGTGVASVVNCERCRETPAWKKAYAAEGDPEFMESEDEVVTHDVAGVSVEKGCC